MSVTIRNVSYGDYGFLCEAFAQVNAAHCEMRPDLYRPVGTVLPAWKFNMLVALQNMQLKRDVCARIAEQDGQKIGAVFAWSEKRSALSWSAFPKAAYLDNIVVLPDHRRQGVGTALLNAAQDWAKKTGHAHMHAKIVNENPASLAFFRQAGFTADSTNVGLHLR